jgi:hypothetical protein
MKLQNLLFATLLIGNVSFAGTPISKIVPVDHAFIPAGFDSNDNVEVVITGYLPNLCHKSPSAKVEIKGSKIDIKMTSLYYQESNPFCPEMVVPFTKSVALGVMDKGNYEITVNGKSPWEKKEKIAILESTSNAVDEFQYAYVQYIDKEIGNNEVALKGYNPSDCFVLDKITHVSNKKDAYSVLPKMKQIREFCPMKMIPFSYDWKVPTELESEKVLIHVRTMDGNSVNTVISTK